MPDVAKPGESPLGDAAASIGDKWVLLLVSALMEGPRRFNDLLGDLSGIAPNILSERLRRLERERVLVATPYSRKPPRHVYELTASGRELAGALRLLAQWGAGRAGTEGAGEGLRHGACGTAMEARWYCPTCAEVVDDDSIDDVRFV
ncbi:MAG: helix-turn-helix transcriptional regulator [Actinomycetota bacterium]|nr:helix-turn-helix transcriptional regulator [Actinomycetota bacterium]